MEGVNYRESGGVGVDGFKMYLESYVYLEFTGFDV